MVNQTAVSLFGWDEPLGKKIDNYNRTRGEFTVVGVVEDYHYESLHQEIRPQALFLSGGYYTRTERFISGSDATSSSLTPGTLPAASASDRITSDLRPSLTFGTQANTAISYLSIY